MKTITFLCFLAIASLSSNAQLYKFTGDWSGKITLSDGSNMWARLLISDGTITQYFWDDNSSSWYATSPTIAKYSYDKNNLIYYWLNDGGVWSETQTFMLSSVSDGKLYVVWSRQVDNEKYSTDNDVWSLQGSGYFKEN